MTSVSLDPEGGKGLVVANTGDGSDLSLSPIATCSDGGRRFKPKAAQELLERITFTIPFGAWLEDTDAGGRRFAVTVRDGRLYGSETVRETIDSCEVNVSWAKFQRSINARAKWA